MEVQTMAMTKTAIIKELAEAAEVTKKQSAVFLEALAKLAYKEAKNGFTFPGVGKLVVVKRKARMGRNPKTGEAIKIAAKTVLKFRVAKAAKEAAL
jgi:DNA-binding protein HU-beta